MHGTLDFTGWGYWAPFNFFFENSLVLYRYLQATLSDTCLGENIIFLSWSPCVSPAFGIYIFQWRASRPFHMGVPPGGWNWQRVGASPKWWWRPRSIHLCAFVEKKRGHPMPRSQKDPQSFCFVFVTFLLCTKVNRMKMCMFSFNRVKLQSFTSSLAWLFWERSAFLSASYSSSWSWNRDIQVLILGK